VFALQQIFSTEPFLLINDMKWLEPWRMLTAIFAHSNPAHLLSNLFALALFGSILEGRIGPRRVLQLFIISGVIINVFSPYERSLGASGAIYAILGALVVLRPTMVVYTHFIPMPMVVAGIVWLLQDIFGVIVPTGNVANLAHISGLFIGVAIGFVWSNQFGDKPDSSKSEKDPELERQLDEYERQHNLRK